MDFGGYFLWAFGAIGLVVLGVVVVVLFFTRSPHRKIAFGLFVAGFAWQMVYGRHLYQVFWLDERLAVAVGEGDADEVRSLLKRGANPNSDFEGITQLQDARKSGHKEIVEILKAAGARDE